MMKKYAIFCVEPEIVKTVRGKKSASLIHNLTNGIGTDLLDSHKSHEHTGSPAGLNLSMPCQAEKAVQGDQTCENKS